MHVFAWFLFLIALTQQIESPNMTWVLVECVVVAFGGVFSLSRILRAGVWSPACLFYIILALFHLGLVLAWIFGIDPDFTRATDYVWFSGPIATLSLVIVLLAMVSYLLGAALYVTFRPSQADTRVLGTLGDEQRETWSSAYAVAGAGLAIAGLVAWAVIGLSAGGVEIFTSSYFTWLSLTRDSPGLSWAYTAIAVGLGLAVMRRSLRIVRIALIVFAAYACVAFFIGLRGEVLYPIAVAASVMAFARRMPRAAITVLAAVAALLLINVAKIVRQIGVAGGGIDWRSVDPLSALLEMGSTLRVVATTVIWHDINGEPLMHGATYVVSLARVMEALFNPSARPPAALDFRLMNSEVAARAGQIGGSAIAEAFHNFSILGVVVVFTIFGLLFGYFSSMRLNATRIAVYVCFAVPMFNHIRNAFVAVVPIFLLGLAFVLLTRIGSGIFSKQSRGTG